MANGTNKIHQCVGLLLTDVIAVHRHHQWESVSNHLDYHDAVSCRVHRTPNTKSS